MSKRLRDRSKNWIDIAALVVSLAAFAVAIRSCGQVNDSNRISLQALQQSHKAFIAENRPLLTVVPLHGKTLTNEYFDVESSSSTNGSLEIHFQIQNVGATPATDIRILPDSIIELSGPSIPSKRLPLCFGGISPLSLAPGEKYVLQHVHDFGYSSGGANVLVELLTSKQIKIETELGISYAAPSVTDQRFLTRVRHALSTRYGTILKSEYSIAGKACEFEYDLKNAEEVRMFLSTSETNIVILADIPITAIIISKFKSAKDHIKAIIKIFRCKPVNPPDFHAVQPPPDKR